MGESVKLPGEKIALIEEFGSGSGTYEHDGVIRASTMGSTILLQRLRERLWKR